MQEPITAPPAPAASVPAAAHPDDPRAVRCGVDDVPSEILGRVPPAHPNDTAQESVEKSRLGFSAGRSSGGPPAPFTIPSSPLPPNAPVDRGRSTFVVETLSRDGRLLDASDASSGMPAWRAAERREDVTRCGLAAPQDQTPLTIEVRLAASGLPYVSMAHGTSLDEAQSRCLAELGCLVALAKADAPTTLRLRGKLAFSPPVFMGEIRVSSHAEGAGSTQGAALAKLDRALTPLARRCVEQTPPSESMTAIFVSTIDRTGRLTWSTQQSGGAAEAILGCLTAQTATQPPPTKGLRTPATLVIHLTAERLVRTR